MEDPSRPLENPSRPLVYIFPWGFSVASLPQYSLRSALVAARSSKRRRRFAPRASPLLAQKSGNEDDFSLEDLPDGHSNISKKHLSSVGDDCFTCLRGWVETGGQVAIVKMEEDAYSELGEIHRNASGR